MQREARHRPRVGRKAGHLAAAVKDADSPLGCRDNDLCLGPDGGRHRLANLERPLHLVLLCRVDVELAVQATNGGIVGLGVQARGLRDRDIGLLEGLKGGDIVGGRPALGNGALLATLC